MEWIVLDGLTIENKWISASQINTKTGKKMAIDLSSFIFITA